MTIHVLVRLFNNIVAKAVLVTLLHSLWLGVVMAILAAVIILFTQKFSSELRYKLLTGLLSLFLISTGYVFYNAINTDVKAVNTDTIITDTIITQQAQNVPQQKDVIATLINFIQTHEDIIVAIWFAVICFKCIQLISGLYALHNLKKRNITEAGTYWNDRMNELTAKLALSKTVVLLQSSLAKIPMIIGHFKPVILFPIGLLNGLPPGEVEAILLHELAHIKRSDFLINLLQRFAEIFFFFNPAVLWISSLIKNERENCCDDIAIAVTHDRKEFIHALVAFQEYNSGLTYATTFPGSKNHLLNRVKRIITNNNKTLNKMEKLILASGIIVTCLATAAFSSVDLKNKKQMKTWPLITVSTPGINYAPVELTKPANNDANVSAKHIGYKNTLSKKEITSDTSTKIHYSGVIDGKKIELTEEDNKVKELYVDGNKIPEDQYDNYASIIDKIHMELKENTAKLKMESDLLGQQKEKMEQQQEKEMKEAKEMKEQSELMKQDFSKQKNLMEQKQVEMKKQAELMNKNQAMSKAESLKMQADLLRQQEKLKRDQMELQKKTEELKMQQEKLKEMLKDTIKGRRAAKVQATTYIKPVIATRPVVSVKSSVSVKPVISESIATKVTSVANVQPIVAMAKPVVYISRNSVSEDIISDLKKANIITTETNLSFRLTNDELIVNGVKQPDDIHQKMLKKYAGKPGGTISLSYNNQQ